MFWKLELLRTFWKWGLLFFLFCVFYSYHIYVAVNFLSFHYQFCRKKRAIGHNHKCTLKSCKVKCFGFYIILWGSFFNLIYQSTIRPSVWLWNYSWTHSCNQPVLSNEGKVSCSGKQENNRSLNLILKSKLKPTTDHLIITTHMHYPAILGCPCNTRLSLQY